ncbi:MAG: contractile injection system protein, VgrG/Pvc8 family, partial [Pantoea sp.]|nr:contractile injection system protein, VgrG/Pvc8 family [Pantoea sp.]
MPCQHHLLRDCRRIVFCDAGVQQLGLNILDHTGLRLLRHFVQRLLEEEGMFYYFEHTAEGHTMIICDDSSTLVDIPEQP